MTRRRHFCLSALSLALPHAAAWAQPSSQPIRILVGFAPGGSVDLTARALAEAMRASLERTVLVENRPGAAGRLVVEATRQARPDGDTLMLVPHGPMTLFPWIHRQLRYDPVKDFAPVGRVCIVDYAITTGPATPAKTVAEYVAWARDPANKAAFASPGAGTIPHFLGQGFAQKAGVEITHVGYKGAAPSLVDLIGGNISLAVTPLADAAEHHRAGKVRILAVTGTRRNPALPEVPTLKESGIDLVLDGWYGLYAPAGTPAGQIDRLYQALQGAVKKIEPMLARATMHAEPAGPRQLAEIQAAETALWGPWVKASGFTPEE
ncbi:tripartite tricarboxylate transporter substrate-binding protein [Xenophilus azovorans]|uniref:tripartite tricarboxylate transporter substrate-binding protein n=1 Tax=Xenophilus azovorans TaxID=151755 RepID=UPI00056EACFB|nr:tripartite tricarboxylate transporter substrate-binding protein [Xenophilus azovorans]